MAEVKFEDVFAVDVNGKTEKKGSLTYLSWSWAWAEFKKIYPGATYEVKKFDGLPYVFDPRTGYMVYTSVTAGGMTYEMWLPVMDQRNATKMDAKMTDINKTIMRCLTKNLAMFGLGLYIYAGEDLPEGAEPPAGNHQAAKAKPADKKAGGAETGVQSAVKPSKEQVQQQVDAELERRKALRTALDRKIKVNGEERRLADLQPETLQKFAEKASDESLRADMIKVAKYKFTLRMKQEALEHPEDVPFPEEA